MSDSHTSGTLRGMGPPVQALFPGLETLCSEGNTISLYFKSSQHQGFSLVGVLCLLLTLPPSICSTTSPHHRWGHQAKAQHVSPS